MDLGSLESPASWAHTPLPSRLLRFSTAYLVFPLGRAGGRRFFPCSTRCRDGWRRRAEAQILLDLAQGDLEILGCAYIVQVGVVDGQVGPWIRAQKGVIGTQDLDHVRDVNLIPIRIMAFAYAGKDGLFIGFEIDEQIGMGNGERVVALVQGFAFLWWQNYLPEDQALEGMETAQHQMPLLGKRLSLAHLPVLEEQEGILHVFGQLLAITRVIKGVEKRIALRLLVDRLAVQHLCTQTD